MKKNIRDRMLEILITPSTVTVLKDKLKDVDSFGTIAYHLKKLEEEGIVEKEKDTSKRGSPTTYSLIDKSIIHIIKERNKNAKISKKAILREIKENPMIEDAILSLFVERADLPHLSLDKIFDCTNEGLATLHFKITKKGERFLRQNE